MGGCRADEDDEGHQARRSSVNVIAVARFLPEGESMTDEDWSPAHGVPGGYRLWYRYDLTILFRNLAVAGALCAAFYTGAECEWRRGFRGDHSATLDWYPGCGREVPR